MHKISCTKNTFLFFTVWFTAVSRNIGECLIAPTDLIPENRKHGNSTIKSNAVHLAAFGLGWVLLLLAAA
jgi:hypothetical protein